MKVGESVAHIFGRERTGMPNSGSKTSESREKMDLLAFLHSPMRLFDVFYSPHLSSTR